MDRRVEADEPAVDALGVQAQRQQRPDQAGHQPDDRNAAGRRGHATPALGRGEYDLCHLLTPPANPRRVLAEERARGQGCALRECKSRKTTPRIEEIGYLSQRNVLANSARQRPSGAAAPDRPDRGGGRVGSRRRGGNRGKPAGNGSMRIPAPAKRPRRIRQGRSGRCLGSSPGGDPAAGRLRPLGSRRRRPSGRCRPTAAFSLLSAQASSPETAGSVI